MSSDLKETTANNNRVISSTKRTTNGLTTHQIIQSEEHSGNTRKHQMHEVGKRSDDVKSTVSQMSKTDSSSLLSDKERRKKEHNEIEQRRKERIKQCIYRMGDLLPPSATPTDRERPSTVEIVERSLVCMREWKEASTTAGVEIQRLKDELASVKQERDAIMEVAREAGLVAADGTILTNGGQAATEDAGLDPLGEARSTNGVSSTTDAKAESPKAKPKKSKRRNTLSAQLQRRELETQQQEMITSSVSVTDEQQMDIGSSEMMNLPGGQFIPGQNMMPLMLPNGQIIMPGMMNGMMGNNQGIMGNQGLVGNNQAGVGNNHALLQNQQTLIGNAQNEGNTSKTGLEESEAGLLQLAMQDAGITPHSSSQSNQGEDSATTPRSEVGSDTANTSQTSALQTLASVATCTQGLSVGENIGSQVSVSAEAQSTLATGTNSSSVPTVSASLPSRTSGPAGYQTIVQNGQMINVPIMGNQTVLQGQQQVMFINEQGIPVIANVPVGMEPNSQGNQLLNNLQKQNSGLDQNALALAQQQSNIAALQSQIIGPNGQNLQNLAYQQQNLLQQGGILPNGQILQQLGAQGQLTHVQGQNSVINLQGQGGMVLGGPPGMLPGNQSGNLLTVPNQQNQLPSALLLPNGQIVPVVTNPGNVFSQAGPTQMSGPGHMVPNRLAAPPHIQAQLQGGQNQLILGPFSAQGSQGLLMPVSSAAQQLATSSGASLSTSVVPTSAIHSVMTTQIQGSAISEKSPSTATPRTDGSSSTSSNITPLKTSQPLPTGPGPFLINASSASGLPAGGIGIPGGNKLAPILITLPINGQPTSVLVDPTTMQVLGTVQQNPPTSASSAPQLVPAPGGPIISQATQVSGTKTSTTSATTASKNKKGNQRVIVPKPQAPGQASRPTTSSKRKSSKSAKVVELAQPDSVSDSLQIQIPESTTEPDTSTHTTEASPSSTDILAKAAESIFSTSMSDLTTPVGGFYNPANEDNPLHIDTSAVDVEDEGNKSPEKNSSTDAKQSTTKTTEKTQKSNQDLANSKTNVIDNLVSEADVTSLSATLEDIADMSFAEEHRELELCNKTSKHSNPISIFNLEAKETKTGVAASNVGLETQKSDVKETSFDQKDVTKDSSQSKKVGSKKRKKKNAEVMDTLDDTLHVLHIPEAAPFSDDLNDVLDQVEHYGSVNIDSPSKVSKKGKTKRSKQADSEGEPNVKKRKGAQKDKNTVMNEPLLSMPTVVTGPLSVYDFDGTDDIVPQLLPLNGKEFSTLTTPSKSSVVKETVLDTNINANVNVQNKNSAQQKADKTSANTSKNTKSAKHSKEVPDSSAQHSLDYPLLVMPETFPADKNADSNKQTAVEKPSVGNKTKTTEKQALKSSSKVDEVLPSMPELDTTTSIFGFPVRKPQYSPQKISSHKSSSLKPEEQHSSKAGSVNPKQTINLFPVPSTKELQVSPRSSSQQFPSFGNFTSQSSKITSVSPNSNMNTVASQNSALVSFGTTGDKDVTVSQANKPNISETVNPKSTQTQSKSVITSASSTKVESLFSFNVTEANIFKEKEKGSNKTTGGDSAKVSESQHSKTVNMNKTSSESVSANSSVLTEISNFTKMESEHKDRTKESHTVSVSSHSAENLKANSFTDSLTIGTSPSKASTLNDSANSATSKLNNSGEYTEMKFGDIVSPQNSERKVGSETGSSFVNTNFSSPYSAEAVFNSPSKPAASIVKSPPNVTVSPSGKITGKTEIVAKGRSNIYSAENFVHSGNENPALGAKSTDMSGKSDFMSSSDTFSRLQNESSSDGFNFANIGLNITPIVTTAPTSSYVDLTSPTNSSAVTSSTTSSSFSFSLSSSSGVATTTTSSVLGQHQFPFYPPMLSSAAPIPSESEPPQGLQSMSNSMFNSNNSMQRNNAMQRRENNRMSRNDNTNMQRNDNNMSRNDSLSSNMNRNDSMQNNRNENMQNNMNRNDNMPRNDSIQNNMNRNDNIQNNINRNDNIQMNRNSSSNVQRVENNSSNMGRVDSMRDENTQGSGSDLNAHRLEDANKPSCSKQAKLTKLPSSSMPDLYPFSSPPNPSEQNFYGNHNAHMKSNMGKSPTEQMHKNQDKVMSELVPPHSRPSNTNPQDKRSGPLDRSPQLMNQGPPYFPPQSYPAAKSLNTPPLHHPPMMDERGRNMTNRSPYESSGPPSSQGFNPLTHNYPGNRFDGGAPSFNRGDNPTSSSFNRDSSGTQPLSHTPMNTGGRKSANPQQQKQPAPPLVSMAMPLQSRPPPPQPSQRPTPPLITPPQAPTPSQISNPSRPKQTASRSSKSKKSKQHPYVEVDSNLSNSIFETNRSMTPFFPVQNLSPQSRAMQHEGSPFLPGNFFGPGPRLPNSNTPLPKNSDLGSPFNPLFPPGRAQNGLGLNFQPGFGMNMNPLHGNHGNGPQITPHTGVGTHMPNFNLNNIFSDVNSSQSESLNISPIKFGHTNSMLQHQPGMEPGAMQHHHQNYRGHPPPPPSVLSMNSILGPNHHGFDGRSLGQMNTSMAPPFHSHGHPPFIPPLNFSMHDH